MTTHEKYVKIITERYGRYKDGSYEEKGNYYFALLAPEQYQNEDEMLDFVEKNPNATLKEVSLYWSKITPDGLAPNDDGTDLLEDDDE